MSNAHRALGIGLVMVFTGCASEPTPCDSEACPEPGDVVHGAGDAGGDDEPEPPMPRVELGRGFASFVTLPPSGGEIELVLGPQGGWHVDVAVRVWEPMPAVPGLRYEAWTVDGLEQRSYPGDYRVRPERMSWEGDRGERSGDRIVFDIASAAEVVGLSLELRAMLLDDGQVVATDDRVVTIVDREP